MSSRQWIGFVLMSHPHCPSQRPCLGTPLAFPPPFLSSQVHRVWFKGTLLTYHLTSSKHHHHIDSLSFLPSTRQTLSMRMLLASNLIIHPHCNIQQRHHLHPRTQVRNLHQTCRVTGRACSLPRMSIFPRNIPSLVNQWTSLRLLWLKNFRPGLLLNLMPCITAFPMTYQHLIRSCTKLRLSHLGSRGGMYSVACLEIATRATYLLWMNHTLHFKAKAPHHPSSERSPRARIAVHYRKYHHLQPQRLRRRITRR